MVECGSLVVLNTPVEYVSSPRPRWAHCCGSVARWSAHTPSTLSWSQERSSVSSVRLQCLMSNSSSSSLRLVWFLPKPTIILLTLFSTLAVTPPLHLTSHLPHFPHSITPSPLLLLFSLLSLLVPNAFHTQLLPPPPMFLPSLPFHPTYFPPPFPPSQQSARTPTVTTVVGSCWMSTHHDSLTSRRFVSRRLSRSCHEGASQEGTHTS